MFFLIAFVTVPFTGVLVRYRLAYHPKEAQVLAADPEAATPRIASDIVNEFATAPTCNTGDTSLNDPASSSSGEVSSKGTISTTVPLETVTTRPTFLSTAKRLHQIEGKSGFYKGIIPTIIVNLIMWISARNYLTRIYISPAPSISNRTLTSTLIGTLFYSFALVWIYRSIATRNRLEVFGTSIKDGIHALFTHFECARPYRIVTPNLLFALLVQILLQKYVFHPLRRMVELDQTPDNIDAVYLLRLGACLVLLLVNTLICAPLDVIVTRLAVQHNYGNSHITTEVPLVIDTASPHVEIDEKNGSSSCELERNDNVAVRYRGENLEPYTSAYDCAIRTIKEEGWTVLYRGWFMTFLGKIYA